MATSKFYMPAVNLMGAGCLQEAAADIKNYGYRKALIVTDLVLNQLGVVAKIAKLLAEYGIESQVFDGTTPTPPPPTWRRVWPCSGAAAVIA